MIPRGISDQLTLAASVAALFALSSCHSQSVTRFCNGIAMTAETDWWGRTVAYAGSDRNGLPLRVDESNSGDWTCVTPKEHARERRAAEEDMRQRCKKNINHHDASITFEDKLNRATCLNMENRFKSSHQGSKK